MNKKIIIIVVALYLIVLIVSDFVLIHDELYFALFGEQYTADKISKIIQQGKILKWIIYLLYPLYLILKASIIAGCLLTGIYFSNYKASFKELFSIALASELVFIFLPLSKLIWFGIFFRDYTLADMESFLPFSLINFFDRDKMEPWLIYPIQLVNIFEILYWLILAYGLSEILGESYLNMLKLVATTYGLGLLLLVIFIMFLTVNAAG
jgi:hypothetical protein